MARAARARAGDVAARVAARRRAQLRGARQVPAGRARCAVRLVLHRGWEQVSQINLSLFN